MSRIRPTLAALLLGALPAFVPAQNLVATIPGDFSDLVVNPVANKVYVTRTGTGIAIVDGTTHAIRDLLVDPTARVTAVDAAANRVYGWRSGALLVVDADDHVNEIPVAGVISAIVPNPATGAIHLITESGAAAGPVPGAGSVSIIANGISVRAAALDPVTGKVYVTPAAMPAPQQPGVVAEIDVATHAIVGIPVPDRVSDIAVNPVTNRIYAGAASRAEVYVIDGATRAVTTLAMSGGFGPQAVLVNPATNKVYVATRGFIPGATCCPQPLGHTTVLDGQTNAVIGGSSSHLPTGLALDAARNVVYVTHVFGVYFGSTSVTAIDGATEALGGFSYPVPGLVLATRHLVAANPVTNLVYVVDPAGRALMVFDPAPPTTRTWPVGPNPLAVAVDPVIDSAYVANQRSSSVTVIRGPSSTLPAGLPDTIAVGSEPGSLAVNPVNHRIYVAARDGVTVIDGMTQATSQVPLGRQVFDVVVNPVTNQVFAANGGSSLPEGTSWLTVIDGDTLHVVSEVALGLVPASASLVLDIATNRVYVLTDIAGGRIDSVDAETGAVTHVPVGGLPRALAADPVSGRVYVALDEGPLAVIDRDTGEVSRIDLDGVRPAGIAVNPRTQRVYVLKADGNLAVVDMDRFTVTHVAAAPDGVAIAVDSVANRIFVADSHGTATIIDGSTLAMSRVPIGALPATGWAQPVHPQTLTVNPVTGSGYVVSHDDNSVTEVRASQAGTAGHALDVDVDGGWVTRRGSPALSASACCAYAPADPAVQGVYYRHGDTWGAFTRAGGSGPFTASLSGVLPGMNFTKLFAVDALSARSTSTAEGSTVMVGAPEVYAFVSIAPVITTPPDLPDAFIGAAYTTTLAAVSGAPPLAFAVTGGSLPPGLALSADGAISGVPSANGFFTFTVEATDGAGGTTSRVFGLLVDADAGPTLANISTRGMVGSGNDLMIGGFVIGGTAPKTVLVTAVGPAMRRAGIANVLDDPALTLVRSSDHAVVAANDDWIEAANAGEIRASGFAPASRLEPAILATLQPGAYTALVEGGTGAGLVAVFEVDHPEAPLVNISTRGQVLAGNDVMIAGFVIQGASPQTVVVTGIGPSLAAAGIANPVADPTLTLVRSSDGAIMATNDNWVSAPNAAQIQAAGFAPADARESAIAMTLEPGAYTAILSGAGGSTGVGIVAVYRR